MKTRKNRSRITAIKSAVLQNILMNRFLHEIEREEPLDEETLQTVLAFQMQAVR